MKDINRIMTEYGVTRRVAVLALRLIRRIDTPKDIWQVRGFGKNIHEVMDLQVVCEMEGYKISL